MSNPKQKKLNVYALGHVMATNEQRFKMHLIDLIVVNTIFVLYVMFLDDFIFDGVDASFRGNFRFLLWFVIYFLYYFLFEQFLQMTVGKFLYKMKVVNFVGEKPATKMMFIRTLVRFLPLDSLSFQFLWLGHSGGWHDTFSDTYVIKHNEPYFGIYLNFRS